MLSDRAVQAKYWLPRAAIQWLITLVSPHIQRATCYNFALSPEMQLLAALRFYAVGSFLVVVGHGTECGSCDTDSPAPCPDPHKDAHHTGRGPPGPPRVPRSGWDPPGDRWGGWHPHSYPQSLALSLLGVGGPQGAVCDLCTDKEVGDRFAWHRLIQFQHHRGS